MKEEEEQEEERATNLTQQPNPSFSRSFTPAWISIQDQLKNGSGREFFGLEIFAFILEKQLITGGPEIQTFYTSRRLDDE